ncbi:universal stress protein [Pseudoxanthomonas putridarboris]|uniref:Universal stress protein n=1 Tax=Pseudoxanthomonas putridarboris TaxID=752605 RepID=A0ABU9J087_9GAMM
MDTIVAALDLETGTDAVLARAIQLATAHAARLLVLHVIEAEPLSQVAALSGRSESDLQEELERQAFSTIEPLLVESGRTWRADAHIEFGAPHEVIARIAGEQNAAVVVIGPGKGRSLKEKVLGSTADRVIRTAAVPVLVVRKASAEPYRQVVAAVDFSPQSAVAVKEARRLVPEAALQLVHAVDIPPAFEQAMLRAGTSQVEMQRYRLARIDKARRDLAAFVRDVAGAGKIDTRVVHGRAGPALVRLSKGRRVDLVVMGPHGQGRLPHALLGSVTQRVLKESGCDVLVAGGR